MALTDLRPQAQRHNATELLLHMKRFSLDLQFSVSLSSLSPIGGRFTDKWHEPKTVPERLEMLAELRDMGVTGIEAQYPYEVNEENLEFFKRHEAETGQRLIAIMPSLHYNQEFEFGSLSNPIKRQRQLAIQKMISTLMLNQRAGTDFAHLWPGTDGFEYSFGMNFSAWRDRFADGLYEAMEAVPGVRVAITPKPGDPRGHQFLGNVSDALLMCARVEGRLTSKENRALQSEGHALVCVTTNVAHIHMGGQDLANEISKAAEQGRLAHTQFNSLAHGPTSRVMTAGASGTDQLEAGLYALKMCGYTGHLGIEIAPFRTNPLRAVRNSIEAVRAANARIEGLDHEHILECATYPPVDRGWIQAYLTRRRAPQDSGLRKLGPPLAGDNHEVE